MKSTRWNQRLYVGLLFGASLLALTASAQEQQTSMESKLHSKFGIKGGLNLTNLYVNDVSEFLLN
jgi:hypothetical protein